MPTKDRFKVLVEFILQVLAAYLKSYGRNQGDNGKENHV